MNLFFPGNPFRIKIFSLARPLKIYFSLGKVSQKLFFPEAGSSIPPPSRRSLFQNCSFLDKGFPNFFSQKTASKIIFSWGLPLKIYLFMGSTSQNLFFPGERLLKFIFSWRRASDFFIDFLHPPDHYWWSP